MPSLRYNFVKGIILFFYQTKVIYKVIKFRNGLTYSTLQIVDSFSSVSEFVRIHLFAQNEIQRSFQRSDDVFLGRLTYKRRVFKFSDSVLKLVNDNSVHNR